jgi:hypothetical protein
MSKLNKLFQTKRMFLAFAFIVSICIASCQKEEILLTNDEINSEVGEKLQSTSKENILSKDCSLPNDLIPIEDPT